MSCLGAHFALDSKQMQDLRAIQDGRRRLAHFHEAIEGPFYWDRPEDMAESGKAWDAMHRSLTDGTLDGSAQPPLGHVVLGGEDMSLEQDAILVLKSPEQVTRIAEALEGITEEGFRQRYLAIDPEDYGMELSEDDLGYTWEAFEDVRALYRRAAEKGLGVLFSADQ